MIKEVEFVENFGSAGKGSLFVYNENTDSFVHKSEHVSNDIIESIEITLSSELINELVKLSIAKDVTVYEKEDEDNAALTALIESIKNKDEKIEKLNSELESLYRKLFTKREEFQSKMEDVEADIANGKYYGELIEDADEAITVYHNLIDFIDKLTA